jgi:hypothetical protein
VISGASSTATRRGDGQGSRSASNRSAGLHANSARPCVPLAEKSRSNQSRTRSTSARSLILPSWGSEASSPRALRSASSMTELISVLRASPVANRLGSRSK